MQKHIYVNGYGATRDLDDGNYNRYLTEVVNVIRAEPDNLFQVYLCGGFTNRTDLTEAACMQRILIHLHVPPNATLFSVEDTTTARDNIRRVRELAGDVPIKIFCEFSRRWTMEYFASKLFSYATIVGVPFDANSLKTAHRMHQLLIKLPIEILAYSSPAFDKLRLSMRRRHVAKARKAAQ